jgi:phosphoglycolate phosphatase
MPGMLSGVIFDKDGTLFDFRRSWAGWAERVVRDLAQPGVPAETLAAAIGFDLGARVFDPASPVISATPEDISAALAAVLPGMPEYRLTARLNALSEAAPMAEAVPLRPVLAALRARGLRLGLATNDAEGPARSHLAAHHVGDLFDFVAGCDSGHGAKPGSGMLDAFRRAFAFDAARVVMVGDSRHDLVAGRAAGMRTVGVLTGIAREAELAPLADAVLPDIGALSGWIDGLA